MLALLVWLFSSAPTLARIPPSFFIYQQMAEQINRPSGTALLISVSRPVGSGNEELLGSKIISTWAPSPGGWPALSILFGASPEVITEAVVNFGIPVAKEQDLVRLSREQIRAAKDPVRPFYKSDSRMKLRRLRKSYAWVHLEGEKSVWIEKDSFLPLKIEGPCPKEVSDLSWAKSDSGNCELEFRNVISARRGAPSNSRITLWRNGNPLLFISFDKIASGRPIDPAKNPTQPIASSEVQAILENILH